MPGEKNTKHKSLWDGEEEKTVREKGRGRGRGGDRDTQRQSDKKKARE